MNEELNIFDLLKIQPLLEKYRVDGFEGEDFELALERLGLEQTPEGYFRTRNE